MKGILITSHLKKETRAMQECLSVFQEYLQEDVQQENSLELDLLQELEQLKQKKLEFVPLPKTIDCIRFCKLSGQQDPQDLVKKIISDLLTRKMKKTRFTQRIIPIQDSCPSHVSSILEKLETLIQTSNISNDSPGSTFKIILKSRFNTRFKDEKDILLKKIANLVDEKHTVDLVGGRNVIIVYILQKIALLSVVCDYFQNFTFNLEAIDKELQTQEKKTLEII